MTFKKVLAIDYGKKWIGLASGDTKTRIAFPQEVVENKSWDFVAGELRRFCKEWQVDLIVMGLPLNMKGHDANKILTDVEKFADFLRDELKREVRLVDERLSTFEAQKKIKDVEKRDDIAAQVILQRFFDSKEN